MRWTTWVSWAFCLIGFLTPIVVMGWQISDMPVYMLFLFFLPYVIVAATSWAIRYDARASWTTLIVSILVSAIGSGSWLLAGPPGAWRGAFLAMFLFLPFAQFLV